MTEDIIYTAGNEEWSVELHGKWDSNNLVQDGIAVFTNVNGTSYKEEISGDILQIDTYINNKIQLK